MCRRIYVHFILPQSSLDLAWFTNLIFLVKAKCRLPELADPFREYNVFRFSSSSSLSSSSLWSSTKTTANIAPRQRYFFFSSSRILCWPGVYFCFKFLWWSASRSPVDVFAGETAVFLGQITCFSILSLRFPVCWSMLLLVVKSTSVSGEEMESSWRFKSKQTRTFVGIHRIPFFWERSNNSFLFTHQLSTISTFCN